MQNEQLATIAVLGGTGKEGGGLALRWAHKGHRVIIGSRTAERAMEAAAQMNEVLGGNRVTGAPNAEAAAQGEIVVLAVPYAAQQSTVQEVATALTGKILIDVTVPLMPPRVSRVQLPNGGSAVEAVQKMLRQDGIVPASARLAERSADARSCVVRPAAPRKNGQLIERRR